MNPFRLLFFRTRQLLCHPFFLLLLLLIPVVALLNGAAGPVEEKDDTIAAGFCICSPDLSEGRSFEDEAEGEPPAGEYLADMEKLRDALCKSDSVFRFVPYDSLSEIKATIASEEIECAYLIPEDLFECLADGKKKNLVEVLSSPKSTMVPVVNEEVYALIFRQLAPVILANYLSDRSAIADLIPDPIEEEQIFSLHETLLGNGSTFAIEFDNAPKDYVIRKQSVLLSPLKGLFALLILLSGFTGALTYYRAAEHPIYARLSVRIVMILSPMLLAALPVLLCMILLPGIPGVERSIPGIAVELARILLYQLLCLAFLLLLTALIRSRALIYAFLPVYLLSCLIFSPIFVNAGQFMPFLGKLSWFFLPTYYLL
ncbi:MAG: hypothetical protein K6E50_12985 [Lachnospiraceae bacterium]|nr:hypothetical protein [Lachnospiraceae bacterium]